jgi:hypothetical protein
MRIVTLVVLAATGPAHASDGIHAQLTGGYQATPAEDDRRQGAFAAADVVLYRFGTIRPLGTFGLDARGTLDDDTGVGGRLALYPIGWSFGSERLGVALLGGIGASAVIDRVDAGVEVPVRLDLLMPRGIVLTTRVVAARSTGDPGIGDALYRLDGILLVPLDRSGHLGGLRLPSGFSLQLQAGTDGLATELGVGLGWGVSRF